MPHNIQDKQVYQQSVQSIMDGLSSNEQGLRSAEIVERLHVY